MTNRRIPTHNTVGILARLSVPAAQNSTFCNPPARLYHSQDHEAGGKTIEEKKFRARCGNKEAAGSQDHLYPQKGVPRGSEPVDEKGAFTA